ncbi:hypothetical protein AAVH_11204 [Aphelenchoides avenae]|nr:hypothetical protein AAVH_11204 [Aphelenchus avenae]
MRSRLLYRLLGLALLAWIGVESSVYCPVVNGVPWKLFREKCYYRYYAPSGINGTPAEDAEEHYKTWFEAREECAKLGAKLASVHDQATQEKVQG